MAQQHSSSSPSAPASPMPPDTFFVRAAYDFRSTDSSSLSFRAGDVIEVLTQLESGWWDGLMGGERGWFPSNHVVRISDEEAAFALEEAGYAFSLDGEDDGDAFGHLARPGANGRQGDESEDEHGEGHEDFWVPQATPDGLIYYYNTQTGEKSWDLPGGASSLSFEQSSLISTPTLDSLAESGLDSSRDRDRFSQITRTTPASSAASPHELVTPRGTRPASRRLSKAISLRPPPAANRRSSSGDASKFAPPPAESRADVAQRAVAAVEALAAAASTTWVSDTALGRRDSDTDAGLLGEGSGRPPSPESPAVAYARQSKVIHIATDTAACTVRDVLLVSGTLSPSPQVPIALKTLQRRLTAALSKVVLTSRATTTVLEFLPSPTHGDPNEILESLERLSDDVRDLARAVAEFVERDAEVDDVEARRILGYLAPRDGEVDVKRRPLGKLTLMELERMGSEAREALRGLTEFLRPFMKDEVGEQRSASPMDPDMPTSPIRSSPPQPPRRVAPALPPHAFEHARARTSTALASLSRFGVASSEVDLLSFLDFDGLPLPPPPDSPDLGGDASLKPELPHADSQYAELVLRVNGLYRELESARSALSSTSAEILLGVQQLASADPEASVRTVLSDVHRVERASSDVLETLLSLVETGEAQLTASKAGTLSSASRIGARAPSLAPVPTTPVPTGPSPTTTTATNGRSAPSVRKNSVASSVAQSARTSRSGSVGSRARGLDEEVREREDEEAEAERLERQDSQGELPPAGLYAQGGRSRSGSLAASTGSLGSGYGGGEGMERSGSYGRPSGGVRGSRMLQDWEFDDDPEASTRSPNRNQRSKLQKLLGDEAPGFPPSPSASKLQKLLGEDAPATSPVLPGSRRPSEPTVPWFLQSKYGGALVTQAGGQVKGGTLRALVERLTTHELTDLTFSKTFLMTHKSFAPSDEVFDLLVERFDIRPPEDLTEGELMSWREKKQIVVQLRVVNVMKSWLETHFDEELDGNILERIRQFAASDIPPTIAGPVKNLMKLVDRRQSKGGEMPRRIVTAQNFPPAPILPKNTRKIRLLDIDPLELARQLTLMESQLYNAIKPVECLNKAWSQDEGSRTHNIKGIIMMSNRIAVWVTQTILSDRDDPKKRAAYIKYFIYVAERCWTLNNFSTLAAIIAGLNSPPINRLKRTWEVTSTKATAILETLDRTLDSSKNFANYKELLRNVNPPCVPFLGVYLTYFTFVADGNPDYLKAEGGGQLIDQVSGAPLINFAKRQLTADLIAEIQQFQTTPYNLTPIAPIAKFITDQLLTTETMPDAYNISLEVEPREREDEKIARLLQESGFF